MSGNYAIFPAQKGASGNLSVQIADGNNPNLDAFSRLRTSDLLTLFDSSHEYGRANLYWDTTTSGAASTTTHLPNESSVSMVCGTEANAYCIRQTKEYFRYQPGKSHFVVSSFLFGAAVAGVTRRVGYFDAQNGVFLEQNGTTDVALVRRSYTSGAAVDERVVQASWNLDTMDGSNSTSNPSGVTLDLSKVQILIVDLQWLGSGRIRMGLDIGGDLIYVHEFLAANAITSVYMTTATLPVRYEIRNTALQGGNNTMKQICSAVNVEGGVDEGIAYHFSVNRGVTALAVTTRRAVLSIRPKATFGPSSRVNRVKITPIDHHCLIATNDNLIEIVYNPTFTTGGGALTWTSAADESAVEYSVHGDANAGAFTGGIVIHSEYGASGQGTFTESMHTELLARLPLVLDSAGANPIALSMVITSVTGTSNIQAAMNWKEIR